MSISSQDYTALQNHPNQDIIYMSWGLIWLTMNVFDMDEKRRFYQSRYLQEIILRYQNNGCVHGPLTRYVKLRVAYAPGMPGTFSPALRASDPDMHHGMCVKHVPWCMPGSLTRGFLWSRWWEKCSLHSLRMRNPQFYVSRKRLIANAWIIFINLWIAPLNFRNGEVISPHTLLWMWLLFRAGIKVNPC